LLDERVEIYHDRQPTQVYPSFGANFNRRFFSREAAQSRAERKAAKNAKKAKRAKKAEFPHRRIFLM
jgi:hypothetical protein